MQMAQIIGGYSLGGADLLRRAMGKKKPEEMAQQRGLFREGAGKNGLKPQRADELFDLMEKFAGYGFNKSHAAAYALVAYHTAYFKAHHAAAFMAANLSAVMNDTDKVKPLYEDTCANGITVLKPDINLGEYRFVPTDEKTVSYGLGAIKGTGESAIENIVRAREAGGPFADLMDFCERVDKRIVNRRVVEALVRAGAFDALDDHRARLLASVGVALSAAEQRERHANQVSLFGGGDEARVRAPLVETARWDERALLREEKTALGYYLSGHPFNFYRAEIEHFVRTRLNRLTPTAGGYGGGPSVLIAGIVESIRIQKLQNSRLVILNLSDGTAVQEVTLYDEVFDQYRSLITEDALLVFEAKVRLIKRGDDAESFIRVSAERVYDLATARAKYVRCIRLAMNTEGNPSALRELLAPYRSKEGGGCLISIVYRHTDAVCEIELGDAWRVLPHDDLLHILLDRFGAQGVELVYENGAIEFPYEETQVAA